MGATEAAGKVATSAIDAMKSTPLAIALLIVNVGFLGFAAYILGEVAANASERNKAQLELISRLVTDIRDCRQPRTSMEMPQTLWVIR
jgi:Tfp pilus assembly protein PilV